MKRLLVWNFSQLEGKRSNTGDRAIFAAMVTDIKKAIPNVEIISISNDPAYTARQYGVTAVYLRKIRDVWKALCRADLIVLGGGEFIQDRSSIPYLILNLSVGIFAILLNKPMIFYAIGVADSKDISTFGKFLTRFVLNRAKLISVRDEVSKEVLESLGVKRPIYVTVDATLTLSPADRRRINEILTRERISRGSKLLVGVAPRGALWGSFNILPLGIQIKLKLAPQAYYIQNEKIGRTIAQTLDYLIDKLDANIIFLPMYTGTNFSYRDHEFALEIINMMHCKDRAKIVNATYSPQELQGLFGEMDIIIGMTLHSLILAATMNVPVVAISYSSKMDRFMQMINQESRIVKVNDIKSKDLLAMIESTWSSKEQIKNDLKVLMESLRERASLNVKLVLNCIGD
jgi:polysaccharide pyruvyl transferase CsaB